MEYRVVYSVQHYTGDAIKNVESEVAKLIKEGWRPLGGIALDDGRVAQAMIRER